MAPKKMRRTKSGPTKSEKGIELFHGADTGAAAEIEESADAADAGVAAGMEESADADAAVAAPPTMAQQAKR